MADHSSDPARGTAAFHSLQQRATAATRHCSNAPLLQRGTLLQRATLLPYAVTTRRANTSPSLSTLPHAMRCPGRARSSHNLTVSHGSDKSAGPRLGTYLSSNLLVGLEACDEVGIRPGTTAPGRARV